MSHPSLSSLFNTDDYARTLTIKLVLPRYFAFVYAGIFWYLRRKLDKSYSDIVVQDLALMTIMRMKKYKVPLKSAVKYTLGWATEGGDTPY